MLQPDPSQPDPAYEALSQSTLYSAVLCVPALSLTEVKAICVCVCG